MELLFFSLRSFREVLNSRRHVLHEIANVVNFRGSVLEEVLGVLLNPLLNSAVECVDEGLRADLQPSDVMDELLSINVVLNGVKELNLFVELSQIRLLSSHTSKDFTLQVFELHHSEGYFLFLFLRLFAIEKFILLFPVLVVEVATGVQELVEGFTDFFLPQEFPLAVLV
jgi:hypothetical protein